MMKRSRDDDIAASLDFNPKNKKPLLVYSKELESNQQFNKPRNLDTGLSRLCNLPDEVLHTILSYLPTNETVRTCILSRRWRHLWKSVPVLDFPDWNNKRSDHCRLNKFVNKVCDLHALFPLQRFHLKYATLDRSDVDLRYKWLEYAITKRRVENLDFRVIRRRYKKWFPEQLPKSLFSSETLVELRLSMEDRALNLPSIIKLPKLKVLYLERVVHLTIQKLVDSAPSLEALHLIECIWNSGVEFERITSLHLRELEIVGHSLSPSMPAVHCPNLEKLTYKGKLVKEFSLCGPTNNLNAATIDLKIPISAQNMFKLLCGVAAVKTLTFYLKFHEYKDLDSLSLDIEEYLEKFPMFENLVELKWSVISTHGITEQTMLNKCPCLKRMEFNLTKTQNDCETLRNLCCGVARTYLKTHLKKVTIRTKYGCLRRVETETVEMLLRRSLILEQLVIVLPEWIKTPKQAVAEAMVNKLRNFHKASTSCRIFVVYYVNGRDIMLTC